MNDNRKIVAVDLGFGDTKVISPSRELFKFPSTLSPVDEDGLKLGRESHGVYQFFPGSHPAWKYRFTGDPSRVISLLDFDVMRRFAPLLAFKALEQIGDVDVLAIGLPLKYWEAYEAELAESMKVLTVNGVKRTAGCVVVVPQGLGVLMDLTYGWDGRSLQRRPVTNGLVVDVGYNTIDMLFLENGAVVSERCQMVEHGGLSTLAMDLAKYLERHFQRHATAQQAVGVLMAGKIMHHGKEVDLTDVCHRLTSEYATRLFTQIVDRYRDAVSWADRIVLAGGGAHYLRGHIPEKYRSIVTIPDSPEFCNARGFFKKAVKG